MPVVHLIDDDEQMRSSMGRLLGDAGYDVRSYAAAGDYLMTEPDNDAGCLLLSLHLPGVSGLQLQAALGRFPAYEHSIIFVSDDGQADVAATVRAMQAGALDFLTRPVDGDRLLAAVRGAVEHDALRRANQELSAGVRSRIASLTVRERSVLQGISGGKLNKQLAAELGVSERTIKADRARVMRRLGTRSLAEMVMLLIEARCDSGGLQ